MAVGPDHIFQWVNTDYAIFDKAGVPLLPSPGFLPGNSLWSGFGGPCETTNQGDPIVQYDKAAGRWIAMQFAFTSLVRGPFYQCVAVSATGNPLGAYYRYSFAYAFFPDYPKLGIWPSAYFVSYNFFGAILPKGGGACALDRAAMLAGAPTAAQVCFGPSGAPMNNFPVDWDGATPPPSGAAGYFAVSNQFNAIHLYRFQINFANPAAATFNDGFGGPDLSFVTLSTPIPRSCRTCIPQPDTTQTLDTLGDRLMFRSVYQNLDGSERLLITHAVDPDGPGPKVAGVRLYEIASPGSAAPSFVTNVTYSPDAADRWMSSAAMDKRGNIAVGYNVSSATVSPGLRLTGRRATDPPNTLQAESVVVNGTGSQINGLSRWGDYSAMQLDPADGCTFWFTGEYMGATGIFNWQTRIASARFPGCL
jgi:hypothetical protein